MAAPVSRPVMLYGGRSRLWWLPAGGLGNGLDDASWVPILAISERIVPRVLTSLRLAGAPAYAAPADSVAMSQAESALPPGYQLWVGASAYGEAEAALLAIMPALAREAAAEGDVAWR